MDCGSKACAIWKPPNRSISAARGLHGGEHHAAPGSPAAAPTTSSSTSAPRNRRCSAAGSRRRPAATTAKASPTPSMALIRGRDGAVRERRRDDQEGGHAHALPAWSASIHAWSSGMFIIRRRAAPGIFSNISWVKETISEIIQCPQTSSATATATALGTKDSVTSWIWVMDCTSEMAKPTTSAVTSTGAESLAATSRPCRPMSRTALVSTASRPDSFRPGR